jgi:hypothetical protein
MKRLVLLVSAFVLIVNILGGFSATHTFAQAQSTVTQVTLADKNALESFAQDIIIIETEVVNISGFDASPYQHLNPEGAMELGSKYLEILQSSYDAIKNDPTKTAAYLKFKTSTAYLNFIDNEKLNGGGTIAYQNVLDRVRIIANQQNAQAVSRLNFEQGRISASQNATQIQNANAQSSSGNAALANKAANEECSLLAESPITGCLSIGVQWLIKNILLEIGGFMVWLTANMFNYAIKIGVLEFSSWAPDSLYPIWLIVRQIVSLIIVFIGLYLGFMYILGKDGFQKYIPWVIMFALFVNFSYPLVRTAIDISNIVSLKIYVSAVGTSVLDPTSAGDAGSLIVSKLGLQGLASSAVSSKGGTGLVSSINSVPAALLAVCYVFYTAYIFFMVTALFVMRTAALVFLIVASPILLVDSVLPMLGERAKLVRKIFFEQLAIGPIFMLMLALTLKFLDVFSASGALSASGLAGAAAGSASGGATIAVFFNILMMLIMLWIMLKVTKSTAGTLGEYATSAMGTVGGFAVGAAAGGTGLLARKGLGGLAMKARDSKWVQNNQDSFLGRRAYNLSNSVANSTFDLRNTAVAGKMAGIGMGMGMGAKLGYDGEAKKKVEEVAARGARIKTKYERDVIKDGVVVARKGDVDPEGVAAKERFHQNSGGTLFLTKKQKDDLATTFVDETSNKDMSDYKKLNTKPERSEFKTSLKNQLDAVSKNEGATSPKAQALMRSIYDIEKQEKEEKKAFDLQLEKEIDRYNVMSLEKRKDYLARLDKEMRDAVIQATTQNSAEPATASQPPSGTALRQERIQKVAEGRALKVEDRTGSASDSVRNLEEEKVLREKRNMAYDKEIEELRRNAPNSLILDGNGLPVKGKPDQTKIDEIEARRADDMRRMDESRKFMEETARGAIDDAQRAVDQRESSRAKAEFFSGNRTERGGAIVGVDITQPYNTQQVSTQSFAEKVAATRKAKLKLAQQAADANMTTTANRVTSPIPATPIPNATTQAPTTQASNDSTKINNPATV